MLSAIPKLAGFSGLAISMIVFILTKIIDSMISIIELVILNLELIVPVTCPELNRSLIPYIDSLTPSKLPLSSVNRFILFEGLVTYPIEIESFLEIGMYCANIVWKSFVYFIP